MTDSSHRLVSAADPGRYQSDWKVDDLDCEFGNIDDYLLVERIGRGKYSTVFRGQKLDGTPCALKVLKPVRNGKIEKEVAILRQLRDGPNIPKLFDIVFDAESQSITLVMELVENVDFRSLYNDFTPDDVCLYVYRILEAFSFAHTRGIIHRDVKPQNIMIDHNRRQLRVIDWGLADYYQPGSSYQVRVATRHYKAPELLLGYQFYTTAVDIWGIGVSFATMLFKKWPIFRGRENIDVVMKIVSVFGGDVLEQYINKYDIQIPQGWLPKIQGHPAKGWAGYTKNVQPPDAALDLLSRMVVIDHAARISAEEALQHPYFDAVRAMAAAE
jgi:casein kinase II subunit alpha